jgi:hypothetical protein
MKARTHRLAGTLAAGLAAIALAAPAAGAMPAGPDPPSPVSDDNAPVVQSIDEGLPRTATASGSATAASASRAEGQRAGRQTRTAASHAPAASTVAESSMTIERPIARSASRVERQANA